MGKDASSGQKIYDWFGTVAGVVCEGPVDALLAIVIDGHEAWPNAKLYDSNGTVRAGDLRFYAGRTYTALLDQPFDQTPPPNATYWSLYSIARGAEDYIDVTIAKRKGSIIRLYWGTSTQTVDSDLQAAGNKFGELHPDYKNVCYCVLKDFWFGREKQTAPNVEIIVQRKPKQTLLTGTSAALDDGQANLFAIAGELLTNDQLIGLDASKLDAASFQTAADLIAARDSEVAISPLIEDQDDARTLFDPMAECGDIFLRFNASTGKIQAGLFAHNSAPVSYTTLTIADLAEPPKFQADGWLDAISRIVIDYSDRARAFKATGQKADDLRAFAAIGEHRSSNLARPFITRQSQALLHAAEMLRNEGRPQLRADDIAVRREKARSILPGDYILLDIDLEPNGATLSQYFRVTGRTIPRRGPIRLKIEADENLAPLPSTLTFTPLSNPDLTIAAIAHARILPLPSGFGASRDALTILAERPDTEVTGLDIHFETDSAGDFQLIQNLHAFAQRATLRSDHNDSTVTLQVTAASQVETDLFDEQPGQLAANDDDLIAVLVKTNGKFILDDDDKRIFDDAGSAARDDSTDGLEEDADGYAWFEFCSVISSAVVSAGNYDLTVLRGRRGTDARAFTAADCEVWLIHRNDLATLLHNDFATLRTNRADSASPDTGFFRLQPFTRDAERDLADCENFQFTFPQIPEVGPTVALTSPAAATLAVSSPYPHTVNITGTAKHAGGILIAWRALIDDHLIDEQHFPPTDSSDIALTVQIAEAGSYTLKVQAYDTNGLTFEKTVAITAAAGSGKVGTPEFWQNGKKLVNGAGMSVFGPIEIRCSTPGATIVFFQLDYSHSDVGLAVLGPTTFNVNDPSTWPQGVIIQKVSSDTIGYRYINAVASKAGLTDSDLGYFFINSNCIQYA